MKKQKPLFDGASWNEETVDRIWEAGKKLATEKYGLTFYEPRFEIVSYEQMLDNYSTVGMPNMYDHWSFGQTRIRDQDKYKEGKMGLAYEMVLNTNPSICYLMEDNSALMQCLVILHAAIGHSAFFKNNEQFKIHTNADTILEDLYEAKCYIQHCEEQYGESQVSRWLSIAQSLQMWGVDTSPRPRARTEREKRERKLELIENYKQNSNELNDLIPYNAYMEKHHLERQLERTNEDLLFPEQNLLRFIADHSTAFPEAAKNIFRIQCDINQYFYPQMRTKLMNEGFATFWHYTLIHDFYEMGYITEGHMIEFYASHSGVTFQPKHTDHYYSGINVYALGFDMFRRLREVCENPTEADRKNMPLYAGTDWVKTNKDIAYSLRDETFVQQCLHRDTAKKFEFFALQQDSEKEEYTIKGIQNNADFDIIRRILAKSYNHDYTISDMEISGVIRGTSGQLSTVLMDVFVEDDGVEVVSNVDDLEDYFSVLLGCTVKVHLTHRYRR